MTLTVPLRRNLEVRIVIRACQTVTSPPAHCVHGARDEERALGDRGQPGTGQARWKLTNISRDALKCVRKPDRQAPMMNRRTFLFAFSVLILAVVSSPAVAAQPEGVVGFSVEVEGDGSFWKPVIKTAKVVGVRSGSPAEAAGLKVGDEILSVQGIEVADSNARKIAKLVQVSPGEHLRLVVRNVAGEVKEIEIIAGEATQGTEAGA